MAKLWSLFHDPSHKVVVSFYEKKSHEEKAREMFRIIFNFDISPSIEEIVKRANELVASFDRWTLSKYVQFKKGFYNILNIFNSEYKAYSKIDLSTLNINEKEFVEKLKLINDFCVGNDVLRYHVMYSVLENVWFTFNDWVSPANSRFPTHTVFDYNYATAMMVNWCLNKELTEYLVFHRLSRYSRIN